MRLTSLAVAGLVIGSFPSASHSQEPPQDFPVANAARVRIQILSLPDQWYVGEAGGTADCFAVVLKQLNEIGAARVAVEKIRRLQVSSIFDGKFDADGKRRIYTPGADTTGERWIEVDVAVLRELSTGCKLP